MEYKHACNYHGWPIQQHAESGWCNVPGINCFASPSLDSACAAIDRYNLRHGLDQSGRPSAMVSLLSDWNELTSPSTPRTEMEHQACREAARDVLATIKRRFIEGVDYKELSNGALWPISRPA